MKIKKNLIILPLSIFATLLIGAATIALIKGFEEGKNDAISESSSHENTTGQIKEEEEEEDSEEQSFAEKIDTAKSTSADLIAEEADSLMEGSPSEAKIKYLEARKMYTDAGNLPRASEMDANAMTAELLVQQQQQE